MEGKRITTCVLWVESCDTPFRYKVEIAIQFFRLDDGAYRIEYGTLGQEILRHFLPSAPYISQVLRKVYDLRIASLSDVEVLIECIRDIDEYERKEKEKETTEMNDYTVLAEHGVSCIITHQKQEETEICVKIIRYNGFGRYEVIYNNNNYGYEPFSYNKFYCGIPSLGDIRDDIQHFYCAGCINVNDIRVLLDEACCVSRRINMAKQLINSRYGLAVPDSRYDIDALGKWWPGIECKTTAKDQYRNREKLPEISEVIFNKPATIVKWADGTKTVVKVQGKERYNKEKGLAMAIAKKAMGNSNYYYTIMERYLEDKK